MGRLYKAKVDSKRWKIVETDNEYYHSYKLIDNEKEEIYYLNHIIGIEQVTEDEFLIYKRANRDEFEIARYRLQNSEFYKLFDKKIGDFYFISDDRIMFTYRANDASCRCGGIYSIKENKLLEEAKWLNMVRVDIYEDDDNPGKIKIYVEEELPSFELNNPILLFTVDPNTLQPNSDCYSQLRDSYIKVSSKEDIERVKSEEQEYINIIDKKIIQKEFETLQKAKTKILTCKNEIK